MTTDVFVAGGVTGLAPRAAEHSYAPLDWLLQHPSTRRWYAKSERANVLAPEIVDLAIDLEGGFEGVMQRMVLLGHSGTQGANSGIGWRIYINRVPYLQTRWQFGAGLEEGGRFDYLHEGDGLGNSWGEVNIMLEENALVEIGMNNNGGDSSAMGWVAWGAYWPTTLRAEYDTYRRAAARREAGSSV